MYTINVYHYQAELFFNPKVPKAELFLTNLVCVTILKLNLFFPTIFGINVTKSLMYVHQQILFLKYNKLQKISETSNNAGTNLIV